MIIWACKSSEVEAKLPCSSTLSSAVSSVISGVHQSLAELVRWSDQRLLYEDDTHNTQTIQEVVQVVKEAVQVRQCTAAGQRMVMVWETLPPSPHAKLDTCDRNIT